MSEQTQSVNKKEKLFTQNNLFRRKEGVTETL